MNISKYIGQITQALDLYVERGEFDGKDFHQARECLDRACYEWSRSLEAIIICYITCRREQL